MQGFLDAFDIYLLEAGTIRASGSSEEMLSSDTIKQAYLGV